MTLIFFLVFSLAESFRHSFLIEHENISPNKRFSFIMRATIGILAMIVDYFHGMIYLCPIYLFSDWWIHDYVLNLFRRFIWGNKSIVFYNLNERGPIDKAQGNDKNWFILKTIIFVLSVVAYYIVKHKLQNG